MLLLGCVRVWMCATQRSELADRITLLLTVELTAWCALIYFHAHTGVGIHLPDNQSSNKNEKEIEKKKQNKNL